MKRKKLYALMITAAMLFSLMFGMPISGAESVLLNSDFESGLGGWTKWAGTIALADIGHNSDSSALATSRNAVWNGPVYSADSILLQTFTYKFSAFAKFQSGSDIIKFAVKYTDAAGDTKYYTIVEDTVGTDWTELAGEWTMPEGSFGYELYFETGESLIDFYVDDVVVIGDADAKLPEPAGDPIFIDFEDGQRGGWGVRGGGTDTVEISDAFAHSGKYSLYESGRTADWHAPIFYVSTLYPQGKTYTYTLWVYSQYTASNFDLTATYNLNGKAEYPAFATQQVNAGTWTKISGNFTIPAGSSTCGIYVGPSPSSGNTGLNYYIDDFSVEESVYDIQGDIPNLKDVFGDYFKVGNAMTSSEVSSPYNQQLFLKHYNSLTFGNELKPEAIIDRAASMQKTKQGDDLNPQVNFSSADSLLKFAIANNIPLRGHTLVWHDQTSDWFFKEGYKDDGAWLSKADMKVRLENYIKNVFNGLKTQYPDAYFYAYDVVNEAFADNGEMRQAGGYNQSQPNGTSAWVRVYGDETFIDDAFIFARKYAPENTKLFYNDYNEYMDGKAKAIAKKAKQLYNDGVLDGIGMQSHLDFNYPSPSDEYGYARAFTLFSEIGCEIQITELDVTMQDGSEQQMLNQADYYKKLFNTIMYWKTEKNANITAVVFWGMLDSTSWRSTKFPLIFDKEYQAKPAFYSIVEGRYDESDPKYYVTQPIETTPTGTNPTGTNPTTTPTTPTTSGHIGLVVYGDIDDDSDITTADLILLAKHLSGRIQLKEAQLEAADCCKTTPGVNSDDLLTMIKYLVGSVKELPVE